MLKNNRSAVRRMLNLKDAGVDAQGTKIPAEAIPEHIERAVDRTELYLGRRTRTTELNWAVLATILASAEETHQKNLATYQPKSVGAPTPLKRKPGRPRKAAVGEGAVSNG